MATRSTCCCIERHRFVDRSVASTTGGSRSQTLQEAFPVWNRVQNENEKLYESTYERTPDPRWNSSSHDWTRRCGPVEVSIGRGSERHPTARNPCSCGETRQTCKDRMGSSRTALSRMRIGRSCTCLIRGERGGPLLALGFSCDRPRMQRRVVKRTSTSRGHFTKVSMFKPTASFTDVTGTGDEVVSLGRPVHGTRPPSQQQRRGTSQWAREWLSMVQGTFEPPHHLSQQFWFQKEQRGGPIHRISHTRGVWTRGPCSAWARRWHCRCLCAFGEPSVRRVNAAPFPLVHPLRCFFPFFCENPPD